MVQIKHLGDITKISGYSVPVVDCVIGGSPCQDLSQAGLRKGLEGERSGLFMEQIRIVKEMREHDKQQLSMRGSDEPVRPRYMVWENVPGAFTSGKVKGADFQAVLHEICKVADKDAVPVPIPEKGWPHAGLLMGDGYSVAWRVHDAQYWGVPQRRKRISLIADFGGGLAGEILFEPKSLSGDSEQGTEAGKRTSADIEGSIRECGNATLQIRGGKPGGGKGALIQTDMTGTIGVSQDKTLFNSSEIDNKLLEWEG